MFLSSSLNPNAANSLLHARGGVSAIQRETKIFNQSSPRSWRCFQNAVTISQVINVFSTLVEVFPQVCVSAMLRGRLLHARGGVSKPLRLYCAPLASSPRSWRCFFNRQPTHAVRHVFSTLVEVFPDQQPCAVLPVRLLHARGGVSRVRLIERL